MLLFGQTIFDFARRFVLHEFNASTLPLCYPIVQKRNTAYSLKLSTYYFVWAKRKPMLQTLRIVAQNELGLGSVLWKLSGSLNKGKSRQLKSSKLTWCFKSTCVRERFNASNILDKRLEMSFGRNPDSERVIVRLRSCNQRDKYMFQNPLFIVDSIIPLFELKYRKRRFL